ncbi:MAG TPA: UDP-2,3-diacylglucosamine diphosphatase LpxI [Terriglobia bacterium]|nr:UDP-2,3-diacylglucosamine diphosphatase LpxI [Terriglobia bacterium]
MSESSKTSSPVESELTAQAPRLAIIAGNGRFPFLVLDAARRQGIDPLVIAIREEASPELSTYASSIHWLSLGEAAKVFELLHAGKVGKVLLAGQVKHHQLYSTIRADGVVTRELEGLGRKNTDALIGTFVKMIQAMGIEVLDSTHFIKPLLAHEGVMTHRSPDPDEVEDIQYGREIAKTIAGIDVGQTVVVCNRACVAVEAMEGTDATIERAATLSNGRRLVVVKVSKPRQDMRFDVPVIGLKTIEVMRRAKAQVLAVDAGKTLLFEREQLLDAANQAAISIVGMKSGTEE